jgi:hypothetical protein
LENLETVMRLAVKNSHENKFLKGKLKKYQQEKRQWAEQLREMESTVKTVQVKVNEWRQ